MVIKASIDPMGSAISDYFQNDIAERLIVNSSITEDEEIGVEYLFRSFDDMPKVEQKALQLSKGKILDVGAAAGCHALYLQNNELDVTAIDVSELSVQVMKAQGLNQVKCADFYNYSDEKYDTVLLLMNGTGIAGNLYGLGHLLSKCKDLLLPNGKVLIDSSDIIYMFEDDEDYIDELEGYYGELEYQMKYKEIEGEVFDWLFVGFDLLKKEAEKAGFNCKLIIEGEHYDYLAQLTIK